jgi:hypothetical protein
LSPGESPLLIERNELTALNSLLEHCDLNLAPLRYERVFRKDGGPIDHLDRAEHHVREGTVFNVNAFLDAALRPVRRTGQLFATADGGGTHPQEMVARFMAISEAIERWAFWDRVDSNMRDLYGFDIDSTTMGMAAFPGLFQARARRSAWYEAVERFALLHWWEGRLHHRLHHHPEDGISVLEILVPGTDIVPVVVFEDAPSGGTRHYGYGAGGTLAHAVSRARRELIRHRLIVTRYVEKFPDPEMGLAAIDSVVEKRALFFALPSGRTLFEERCKAGPWAREGQLKTVFDGWVPGDWNRYAVVWRCLFEPPSDEYASNRADYFLW